MASPDNTTEPVIVRANRFPVRDLDLVYDVVVDGTMIGSVAYTPWGWIIRKDDYLPIQPELFGFSESAIERIQELWGKK